MKTDWVCAVVLVSLLSVVAGCAANPVTGEQELWIPDEQEIALGVQAAPQFEAEFGGKLQNESVQEYVRSVGAKIAEGSDRGGIPYEYTALNSKVPNAFALPGGKIYITVGLLKLMDNERELAAVLGHETGHVAAKHNINGLKRQIGAQVLLDIATQAAGEKGASAAKIAQVVTGMGLLKYSRDDEYMADEVGVRYMTRAGYNPWGMVELLNALKETSTAQPGLFDEMFQTHPLTQNRIDRAVGIIQREHPGTTQATPDPGAARFGQIKALVK